MIKALKEGKVRFSNPGGIALHGRANHTRASRRVQIGGAGLDVFEAEPEIPEELLKNERIALLPHLGTATVETRGKVGFCSTSL